MRTKHTPGPWKHAPHLCSDGYRVFVPHEADNDQHDAIADLETWQTPEQTEANARLMAAAPDLLRVVESVFLWDLSKSIGKKKPDPLYPSIIADARAALTKAGL